MKKYLVIALVVISLFATQLACGGEGSYSTPEPPTPAPTIAATPIDITGVPPASGPGTCVGILCF